MRKNDKALFIGLMAFMLALFAYFKTNTTVVEGLVPGFEKAMHSNWKVQNRSDSEDDIVFNYKNSAKFIFKPDGLLMCKDIKLDNNLDCNHVKSTQGLESPGGAVSASTLTVKNESRLNNWRIAADRIGIAGKEDLWMGNDKWLRLVDYGRSTIAGSPGKGGFASFNLWTDAAKRGRIYAVGYGGPGTPLLPHGPHSPPYRLPARLITIMNRPDPPPPR
jgi:hypothetical protein